MNRTPTTFDLHPEGATRPRARDHIDVTLPLWREWFAGGDWLALRMSPVFRGEGVPHGDGSAIVLIPGMLASDWTMREMARWLRRMGYRPYLSGIGRNDRCPEMSLADIVRTVDRAYDETGRKVGIVGHSLGGLLSRGAATLRPRQVSTIITLGSPVNGARVHPFVRLAAEMMQGDCDGECLAALQQPLPSNIREVNVYSRTDGIVSWRTCIRPDATSLEVPGTHVGMVVNPAVYGVLANALMQGFAARTPRPFDSGRRLAVVPTLAA